MKFKSQKNKVDQKSTIFEAECEILNESIFEAQSSRLSANEQIQGTTLVPYTASQRLQLFKVIKMPDLWNIDQSRVLKVAKFLKKKKPD